MFPDDTALCARSLWSVKSRSSARTHTFTFTLICIQLKATTKNSMQHDAHSVHAYSPSANQLEWLDTTKTHTGNSALIWCVGVHINECVCVWTCVGVCVNLYMGCVCVGVLYWCCWWLCVVSPLFVTYEYYTLEYKRNVAMRHTKRIRAHTQITKLLQLDSLHFTFAVFRFTLIGDSPQCWRNYALIVRKQRPLWLAEPNNTALRVRWALPGRSL